MKASSLIRNILLAPLVPAYLLLHLADKAIKSARRKAVPSGIRVISVGNLTTGGTGKTPLVMLIAGLFKAEDPVILSRGYGALNSPGIITGTTSNPAGYGDEPALIFNETGCAVSVHPDRYKGFLQAKDRSSLFIMDDGFQHYAMDRDVDIVVLDATDPFGLNMLLPAGNLREPACTIRRADIVIINRSSMVPVVALERIKGRVTRYGVPPDRIFTSDMENTGLFDQEGKKASADGDITAFAGIGNFSSFMDSARQTFPERRISYMRFPDHHAYSEKDIKDLDHMAEKSTLVTTAKDGVKLKGRLGKYLVLGSGIRMEGLERFKELLEKD